MTPFRACPHCGGRRFIPGPRGGLAINVTCAGCSARFNIILPAGWQLPASVLLINALEAPTHQPQDLSRVSWLIELN